MVDASSPPRPEGAVRKEVVSPPLSDPFRYSFFLLDAIEAIELLIHEDIILQGTGKLPCPGGCEQLQQSYESLVRHCEHNHSFQPEYLELRMDNRREFEVSLTAPE